MERLTRRMCGGWGMTPGHELSTPKGMREAVERLAAYEDLEEQGRLIVLDNRKALAIAAGIRAISTNKRCDGATYVYDPFGEDGGPYEIPYATAQKILSLIWHTCPLAPIREEF